jgi:hypothetical protein
MPARSITPRLANSLRSLAESQLQTQVARSGTFDLGALGVVSVCAAIAAIVLGVGSAHHLWIAALVLLLLALALGLAVRALFLPGAAQIGPPVAGLLDARATDDDETIEEWLLEDLASESLANERALARKDPLLVGAVTLLVLAIALELTGVQ